MCRPCCALHSTSSFFLACPYLAVGKSAFGSYLLFRAVRAQRTVVYHSAKVATAWIFFSNGSVEEVVDIYASYTVLQLLEDYSTVFISDSITPKRFNAFTILITSPNRDRWKEFFKEPDCKRLFFPVFSLEEIVQLQAACFPHVEGGEEGMAERYARWGGIPRYVLAKTDIDAQKQLEAALTSPDYRQLADILSKEELESEAASSHRLLHLKVRGELEPAVDTSSVDFYALARTELGSSYIADKVCEAMMASADNQLRSLLSLSPRPPSVAELYGEYFERAALKILGAGGNFRVRLLQGDGKGVESDLVLPPATLPVAGFRTMAELATLAVAPAAAVRVLRPISKSFCAVDFILQGKRPANATVNKSHALILKGVKLDSGLLPVAEAMGLDKPVVFFWVVPEEDFSAWTKPRPLQIEGKAPGAEHDQAVVQYALAVHIEMVATVPADASGATLSDGRPTATAVSAKPMRRSGSKTAS